MSQRFPLIFIAAVLLLFLNACDSKKANSDKLAQAPKVQMAEKQISVVRDELKDGGLAPDLVAIPAGSAMLGDISGAGREEERPAYRVEIKEPFAMGKYEVTFEEYDRFCEATGRAKPVDEWGRGRNPVIRVTWEDASAYVDWLGQQTGKTYFLPSEAQWEYAARAGTATAYWWGDEPGDGNARCGDCLVKYRCVGDCSNVDLDNLKPEEVVATTVGSYKPNPFGLHDMLGNVAEWTADCWNERHLDKVSDGSARLSGDCSTRVTKAGSWLNNVQVIRPAVRVGPADGLEYKGKVVGFRVARKL